MTQKELLYVKTVADEKSISKAAKTLFLAQPSLSQSIQRIEDSLGTSLFIRTPNGLTLTYAGERYYHMAVQILQMYADFEIEISDINNLRTGRIHMGITNHLGTLVLPAILPRFCELCPFIQLSITEETSHHLEQKLLSSQLDFAIMHSPIENAQPQIQYEFLLRDPFVIALAANHPLLDRAEEIPGYPFPVLDIKLLKNETFLMLPPQQRIRQVTNSVLVKAGIHQPKMRITLRNFQTIQTLAAQGLGVTLLPSQYVSLTNPASQPVFCSIHEKYDAGWDLSIATLKNRFLSKADHLLIRIAKEIFFYEAD